MTKWLLISSLFLMTSIWGEQTLSLIKPDAVRGHHIGEIICRFEKAGLNVIALKMIQLTPAQAEQFYQTHVNKPFFKELTQFISSDPIVAIVLEGPNAVARNRELMGATDYRKALPGTLRRDFAKSMTENAVHGSDSVEAAQVEIALIFKSDELIKP